MSYTPCAIIVEPTGQSLSVSINRNTSSGPLATSYTTQDGSTPHAFPVAISERTVFWLAHTGVYYITGLLSGSDVLARTVSLSQYQVASVVAPVAAVGGGLSEEEVEDAVGLMLVGGTNINVTYDDGAGTATIAVTGLGGGTYTDELAQDAIGTILVDSSTVDFTYTDATPAITAAVLDSPLLGGQTSAYHLARANHTGTQSADTIVDGATNHVFTATEETKLAGIATGATANSSDATLLARANHTGTQSADTIVDGSTNHVFTTGDDTKLAGIATAATANDTDANLKARANHTGTQLASTVSDFSTAVDARMRAIAYPTTITTRTNSTSELVFATATIPANKLAAGDTLRLTVWGTLLANSGGNTWIIKAKFGATTMVTTLTSAITAQADPRHFLMVVDVDIDSTSSQSAVFFIHGSVQTTGTWQVFGGAAMPSGVGTGVATEATSAGKDIALSVQWSAANTSLAITPAGGTCVLIEAA